MKLDYTEFSFGYAFTENLIRSAVQGPSTAPVFPNLVQEGRLGYDVKINLPGSLLFLQYKLPKLMVRESASEISNYHLPGIFTPFFRMSLMRRDQSDQHKLLIELEREPPNSVYYASPVLENVSQLNNAYAKTSVHMESVFFSPGEIGLLPDNKGHTVVYKRGLQYAWRCSDPQEIKAFGYKDLMSRVSESLGKGGQVGLQESIQNAWRFFRSHSSPSLRKTFAEVRRRSKDIRGLTFREQGVDQEKSDTLCDLLALREVARVQFGYELILAQTRS